MTITHTPLDKALDAAMELPPDQREMLVAILQKRQIEARRQEIADDARESIGMFEAGHLKRQSAEEILRELHEDRDDYE
jgi:hypothetical protein